MSLTQFNAEPETIKILAFKRSGKYYTDYDVKVHTRTIDGSNTIYMQDVFDQVGEKILNGELPADFYYLVDHPQGYPRLFNIPSVPKVSEVPFMGGRYA